MNTTHDSARPRCRRGFTLLEVLVVAGVISLLVAILLPALSGARKMARTTRDLAAARQLMPAYQLYADENRGFVLPGYAPAAWVSSPPGPVSLSVADDTGEPLSGVLAQRYPWRLAPYLNYDFAGLYLDPDQLSRYRARTDFQYVVSLSPSLGINGTFVGGDADRFGFNSTALGTWGSFYITRSDQVTFADRLIAFASARGGDPDGGSPIPGYFRVDAPARTNLLWSTSFDPAALPSATGHVDFRHDADRNGLHGKAVTTAMDGHAELLTFEQALDMRRWANQADREDWRLGQ
jgi:prepilin-type N-terminal cleavage/methylation domain-containing protein